MKYLILFVLVLLIATTNYSQNDKGWELSLDAGFNLSTMKGKYSENDDSKRKWIGTPAVGIKSAYNFTSSIALMVGFYMMKSGVLYENKSESATITYEWTERQRFTALRIPVTVRYTWGNTWQYYALAGIYVSKRLCGKYVYTNLNTGEEESGNIKFENDPDESYEGDDWILDSDEFKRVNFGIVAGFGIRRALGPGLIGFNATFGYGFCDFHKWEDKSDKPDGYNAFNDKNIAFMFTYAVMISSLKNK